MHFLVFFCGTAAVVLFVMRPDMLDRFGQFFGIARGADLIVYLSIILLSYLYFELLNKHTKQKITLTNVVTSMTLLHADQQLAPAVKGVEKDTYGFLIRAYNECSVIS